MISGIFQVEIGALEKSRVQIEERIAQLKEIENIADGALQPLQNAVTQLRQVSSSTAKLALAKLKELVIEFFADDTTDNGGSSPPPSPTPTVPSGGNEVEAPGQEIQDPQPVEVETLTIPMDELILVKPAPLDCRCHLHKLTQPQFELAGQYTDLACLIGHPALSEGELIDPTIGYEFTGSDERGLPTVIQAEEDELEQYSLIEEVEQQPMKSINYFPEPELEQLPIEKIYGDVNTWPDGDSPLDDLIPDNTNIEQDSSQPYSVGEVVKVLNVEPLKVTPVPETATIVKIHHICGDCYMYNIDVKHGDLNICLTADQIARLTVEKADARVAQYEGLKIGDRVDCPVAGRGTIISFQGKYAKVKWDSGETNYILANALKLDHAEPIQTYCEVVKISDTVSYQRKHDGKLLCTYAGFNSKQLAERWARWLCKKHSVGDGFEIRSAKRIEGFKWELKVFGMSMKQIEKLSQCALNVNPPSDYNDASRLKTQAEENEPGAKPTEARETLKVGGMAEVSGGRIGKVIAVGDIYIRVKFDDGSSESLEKENVRSWGRGNK